jgi:hypothetical protein
MRVTILILLFATVIAACSFPDPSDVHDLEELLKGIPKKEQEQLRRWAARRMTGKWLEKKSTTEIAKIQCKMDGYYQCTNMGKWWDWTEFSGIDAKDVAQCMFGNFEYTQCLEQKAEEFQREWNRKHGCLEALTCRAVPNTGYDPDQVTAEVLGNNESKQGDAQRMHEMITLTDVVNALIESNAPPPLPGGWQGLRVILPSLCALGEGWGCPNHPAYPRDDTSPDTGDN